MWKSGVLYMGTSVEVCVRVWGCAVGNIRKLLRVDSTRERELGGRRGARMGGWKIPAAHGGLYHQRSGAEELNRGTVIKEAHALIGTLEDARRYRPWSFPFRELQGLRLR